MISSFHALIKESKHKFIKSCLVVWETTLVPRLNKILKIHLYYWYEFSPYE